MASPDTRRRDQAVRSAILQAARDLADEDGYGNLTVERVAKRAGAGKQTIYRWWPSLHAVVIEALVETIGDRAAFPDTGDIRADLRTQMRSVVRLLNGPLKIPYTGLIGVGQADETVAAEVYQRIIEPHVQLCCARIERAQAQGEIRADIKPADVMELVYAPLYYRLLLRHGKPTYAQVDLVLQLAFEGLYVRETARMTALVDR